MLSEKYFSFKAHIEQKQQQQQLAQTKTKQKAKEQQQSKNKQTKKNKKQTIKHGQHSNKYNNNKLRDALSQSSSAHKSRN